METTVSYVLLGAIILLLLWRLIATENAAIAAAREREQSHASEVEDDLARVARITELEAEIEQLAAEVTKLTTGPVVHRRVVASLTGDEGGIDGILTGWQGDWVRFESVQFVGGKGSVAPVDGAVHVPRGKILALHEPPAPSAEAD